MKQISIGALCIGLLLSCQSTTPDSLRSFMPGTYVTNYSNEYSQGMDTLTLTALSKEGNNYRIERSTTYQRIKSGKLLQPESKKEQWLCIYNARDKVLNETHKGKVISFIPEKGTLLVGTSEYKKIDR